MDSGDPQARLARRTWLVFGGSFSLLGLLTLLGLLLGRREPLDLSLGVLVLVAGTAALLHRQASVALEARRRGDAESFARILQALSRSVSPDAVVAAIVEELGAVAAADHVVFVRLRPDTGVLDVTLVTLRPGVPASTTVLSADLLERAAPKERPRQPVPIVTARRPEAVVVAAAPNGADITRADPAGAVASDDRPEAIPAHGAGAGVGEGEGAGRRKAPEPAGRAAGSVGRTGAVGRVAAHGQAAADRIAGRVRDAYGLRNLTAAPLVTEAGVVGAIVLSRRTDEAWSPAARGLLESAASEASAALSRLYSQRATEAMAATDALTGLPNRRYFDEFCSLLARRRRAADTVGVLMVDIDHFKRVNDRHGHTTGDAVLRVVATAIARSVRDDDVPARYGGEEFVVLLRNPSAAVAVEIGERIRWAVRSLDLGHLGIGTVTVSVGVGVGEGPGEPVEWLIEQADRALYRAKREGRDRVVAG
ncbi:MAG: diguanylate cyclase [Candidatus Limnocylindrales bacterium]